MLLKVKKKKKRATLSLFNNIKKTAKVEEAVGIPKVDTIISEPIGILLLHERMVCFYKCIQT